MCSVAAEFFFLSGVATRNVAQGLLQISFPFSIDMKEKPVAFSLYLNKFKSTYHSHRVIAVDTESHCLFLYCQFPTEN